MASPCGSDLDDDEDCSTDERDWTTFRKVRSSSHGKRVPRRKGTTQLRRAALAESRVKTGSGKAATEGRVDQSAIVRRVGDLGQAPDGGLQITCSIGGEEVACLVDTGAEVSLLATNVFDTLRPPPATRDAGLTAHMADGSPLLLHGKVDLSVSIGGSTSMQTFYLAQISQECILGMDFLRGCKIDLEQYKLTVPKFPFSHHPECNAEVDVMKVSIAETVVIPGRTSVQVVGKFSRQTCCETLIEASERSIGRFGCLLARVCVGAGRGEAPLDIVNPTDEDVRVPACAVVATCCEVTEVSGASLPLNENNLTEKGSLPDALNDLLERSAGCLSQDQATEVEMLLRKHRDVFAANKEELGRTSLTQHEINAGDARPIKQPARRMAYAMRNEAEEEIGT